MSVLILVLPFWVLGILVGWYSSSQLDINPVLIILLWLFLFVLSFLNKYIFSRALPSRSFGSLLLIFLTSFLITTYKSGGDRLSTGESIVVIGEVKKVWEGPNSNRIKLKVTGCKNAWGEDTSGEMILLMLGSNLHDCPEEGSLIKVETHLDRIVRKTNSKDFPEQMYWAGEGIRKKGWMNAYETIEYRVGKKFDPLVYSGAIQNKLCCLIDGSIIGKDQASVVKAMLLGQKEDLAPDVKDVFRHTGISHLLAVSGLHVGLVYLIIIRLFFFLKASKAKVLIEVLAVLAVWFYSFMTGFGPSVQRAAGMISLFAISRLLGRKVQPMQVLVLAFLFQSAINPFAIFSFGFQLSYLAVAGIFVVYRPWTRLINSSKLLVKKVWDFAGVSIAAQTFTLPFILIYFHEFPVYFLLGNLMLVPLGLIVFYLGIGYILILSSGLSINLLAQVLDKMVSLLLSIGKGIAGFPLSMINFDSFSILNLILYYLIIAILFKAKRLSLYKRVVYIVIFTIGLKIMSLILGV